MVCDPIPQLLVIRVELFQSIDSSKELFLDLGIAGFGIRQCAVRIHNGVVILHWDCSKNFV